jgi:hypothetical protein
MMMTLGELLEMYRLDLNGKVDADLIADLHLIGGLLGDIIYWDDPLDDPEIADNLPEPRAGQLSPEACARLTQLIAGLRAKQAVVRQ